MKETEDTLAIRQYLLGRLRSGKKEDLERRLLTDNAYLEELLIAEDELVDEYVAGKLAPEERESFQQHFLSTPGHKEKLRFAKTFKRCIDSSRAPDSVHESEEDQSPSWFQSIILSIRSWKRATAFSMAAALLFAVLAGVLLIRDATLRQQLRELRAEKASSTKPLEAQNNEAQQKLAQEAERNAQLTAELERAQQERQVLERETARLAQEKGIRTLDNRASASYLAPILAMGAVRSGAGGMAEIRVEAGYSVINIPLRLPSGDAGSYRASLLNADGKTLYTRIDLRPREISGQPVVLFNVPAKVLTPGEYRIRLSQATGQRKHVGSYDFRVS